MSEMYPEPPDNERYWKDKMDAEKDELMEEDIRTPIGCYSSIRWKDSGEIEDVYISFGTYKISTNTDSYGIDDDFIFYYSDLQDAQVGETRFQTETKEFTILSCAYRYE